VFVQEKAARTGILFVSGRKQKIFKQAAFAEPSLPTAVSPAFRTFAAKLIRRFLL